MNLRFALPLVFLTAATLNAAAEDTRLRDLAEKSFAPGTVYIGAACPARRLDDLEGELLARHFSYITPANEFKQTTVHPRPDFWNWDLADAWIDFAEEHDQVIRIHGPISPQCSTWAKDDHRSPDELLEVLEGYVTELCRRYNGHPRVKWMDVVNETVDWRTGNWFGPRPGNSTWENPWLNIGLETDIPEKYIHLQDGVPIYIIRAFEIASKEAPDIGLVLNQHGTLSPEAWNRIKDLVLYLRERGLRVDGIGWQAHIRLTSGKGWADDADSSDWTRTGENTERLGQLIDWAHDQGLAFHITEMNIHEKASIPYDGELFADVYDGILRTLLERRRTGLVTWNAWTLVDRPHWKSEGMMMYGLWDERGIPQPTYQAVRDLLEFPPLPLEATFNESPAP